MGSWAGSTHGGGGGSGEPTASASLRGHKTLRRETAERGTSARAQWSGLGKPQMIPSPRSEPLLEVYGVTKRFGGFVALESVDILVQPGDRLGLIGPDGSGRLPVGHSIAGRMR